MKEPTNYELITHRGRQIAESKMPGYCGSCDIETHCAQVRDPKSWVQSSLPLWAMLGRDEMDLGDG